MFEILNTDIENIILVLFFIIPGMIILFIRSQFLSAHPRKSSEAIISYLLISIFYHTFIFTILFFFFSNAFELFLSKGLVCVLNNTGRQIFIFIAILVFVFPGIIGLLLGLDVQKEITYKIANCFCLDVIHPKKTAWDYKFAKLESHYISITLKNGTEYIGCLSQESIASSDPNERDVYMDKVYGMKKENEDQWEPIQDTSVLILSGEIRTIKFFKKKPNINVVPSDDETE